MLKIKETVESFNEDLTLIWDVVMLSVALRDPTNEAVLIEGVLFRASYLGSTQLVSEGQPSKRMRTVQAQEAVNRIKVWSQTNSHSVN